VEEFAGALAGDEVSVVDGVEGSAVEEGVHWGIIRGGAVAWRGVMRGGDLCGKGCDGLWGWW
jgi:hypothetical protein